MSLAITLIIQFVILIVGFFFLIKGADVFVEGASSIASLLKIPTIIVGLTIVALGTSAPEAAVSITASITGENAIAVTNVIGSNICNLLLILGTCAIVKDLKVGNNILEKDFPFLILITIITAVFILTGGNILRIEGIVLLILLCIYLFYLIYTSKKSKEAIYVEKPKLTLPRSIIYILIGLAGVTIGGQFVVNSASEIARCLGMSETLIGLTIVALGTSLPELVTSLAALKRNENQLVIGNIIGSNIFNIVFVLGLSSAISPIFLQNDLLIDLVIVIFSTILCFLLAKKHEKFERKGGILLLLIFICYMIFAIIRN